MMHRIPTFSGRQRGVTLIELLVAAVISLIAASAMVVLMANTLGTGSTMIASSNLSAETRAAMSVMTRELRRANYHANFMKCFGNAGCREILENGDADARGVITNIGVTDNGNSDCIWFWYDRDADGVVISDDAVGAFRRAVDGNGIGRLQMTTTSTGAPNCATAAGWVDVTDPDVVNITEFNVSNADTFTENLTTAGDTQRVEKIELQLAAQLTDNTAVSKEIVDYIRVRNDLITAAP